MNVLIIGCDGFIGSHLVERFSKNHTVFGAGIFEKDGERYFLLEKDNTSFDVLFKEHRYDVCINASGNGNVGISIQQPEFDYELNVHNTFKILSCIRKYNPTCKFVNLSSAAVYGNPQKLPITEDTLPMPISPYGWHKYLAEQICKEFYCLYKVPTVNLRLFSMYGEGLKKQLFWDLYQKSVGKDQVELFGTGSESRDFLYIDDLISAVECVLHNHEFDGAAVNIASGVETTIATAAGLFCKAISDNLELKFSGNAKPGDPNNWRADITELSRCGFKAQTSMEKGLTKTANWLKSLS